MTPWHLGIVQSEVEMFDRKTAIVRFNVKREFKHLQFGMLNYRARIEISKDKNIGYL